MGNKFGIYRYFSMIYKNCYPSSVTPTVTLLIVTHRYLVLPTVTLHSVTHCYPHCHLVLPPIVTPDCHLNHC